MSDFFKLEYEWDAFVAKSVWAFGFDAVGFNALLDDILLFEVDKGLFVVICDFVV